MKSVPYDGGLVSIGFASKRAPKNAKLLEFCTPLQTVTQAPANTYQSATCAKLSNFALVNEVLENPRNIGTSPQTPPIRRLSPLRYPLQKVFTQSKEAPLSQAHSVTVLPAVHRLCEGQPPLEYASDE